MSWFDTPLRLLTDERDGVSVLTPVGPIAVGPAAESFGDALGRLLDAGAGRMVINLSGVSLLDSSGLGEMVAAARRARERGAVLALAEVPGKIADLLRVVSIDFPSFDSEDEAVDALRAGGGSAPRSN